MCSIESLKQQSVKSVHTSWQAPMWALSFVLCWCEDRMYWEPFLNWWNFFSSGHSGYQQSGVHSMSSSRMHVCTDNSLRPHPGCWKLFFCLVNWGSARGWWGDGTPRKRWGSEMNTEQCWFPTKSDMTEHMYLQCEHSKPLNPPQRPCPHMK